LPAQQITTHTTNQSSKGAGNIVDSPRVGPVRDNGSNSEDVIPEPAMRNAAGYDNFHTGVSSSHIPLINARY